MNQIVHPFPRFSSVDAFLAWSERQERGKFELIDGEVIMQQSQRWGHADVKSRAFVLLSDAVKRAGLPYYAAPDGMTVRPPNVVRAFEPDAMLAALPTPAPDSFDVANPLVIVEVLSPGTAQVDITIKLKSYFEIETLRHYLVLDPDSRMALHFRRGEGDALVTRVLTAGKLLLDPPDIEIEVEALFR